MVSLGKLVSNKWTYLALKVHRGGAREIALVVRLLQGRRRPWTHHLEYTGPPVPISRQVGGVGESDDLPQLEGGGFFA